MTRRPWVDESGVALGLAVIVVVLIGVLAAGLLAVVRSDLEGVIQANRGQRALDLADAGSQAAAARLRMEASPERYDADAAGNSDWAYVSPDDRATGKTLDLDGGAVTATIRYLLPATTAVEQRREDHAPERVPPGLSDYPEKDFYLIACEAASEGTRRKVEVIVYVKTSEGSREVVQWSWREVYE